MLNIYVTIRREKNFSVCERLKVSSFSSLLLTLLERYNGWNEDKRKYYPEAALYDNLLSITFTFVQLRCNFSCWLSPCTCVWMPKSRWSCLIFCSSSVKRFVLQVRCCSIHTKWIIYLILVEAFFFLSRFLSVSHLCSLVCGKAWKCCLWYLNCMWLIFYKHSVAFLYILFAHFIL